LAFFTGPFTVLNGTDRLQDPTQSKEKLEKASGVEQPIKKGD